MDLVRAYTEPTVVQARGDFPDVPSALQAQSIGDAMGGSYTGYRVGEEVDKNSPHPKKAAKDAMKGVDPSVFKSLEK